MSVLLFTCIFIYFRDGKSLAGFRGGLISVKEGAFQPSPSFLNFIFIVNKANHTGADGSSTIGDPVWINDDATIRDELKSIGKGC